VNIGKRCRSLQLIAELIQCGLFIDTTGERFLDTFASRDVLERGDNPFEFTARAAQ
jgi:hypothetical protein